MKGNGQTENLLPGFIANLPEILEPEYKTTGLNGPIELFRGRLLLRVYNGPQFHCSDGTLRIRWLPSERLEFTGIFQAENRATLHDLFDTDILRLALPDRQAEWSAMVTHATGMTKGMVTGFVTEQANIILAQLPYKVMFHLANFVPYVGMPVRIGQGMWKSRLVLESNRLVLESKQWRVTVDGIHGTRELLKQIKLEGGFVLSHVGELTSKNEAPVGHDAWRSVINGLHFFFAFSRGLWCGPLLTVGKRNDVTCMVDWTVPRLSAWRSVRTWFPDDDTREVSEAFKGFMDLWHNAMWREAIRLAIDWFVEANAAATTVESSIVMTQTALETLSWVYLAEAHKICSPNQFDQMKAETRLRNLLQHMRIPVTIPPELKELNAVRRNFSNSDGPGTFTGMRNAIVHPTRKNRTKIFSLSGLARAEARDLGLWYLELVLLHLMNYKGVYIRRWFRGWKGDALSSVPWV